MPVNTVFSTTPGGSADIPVDIVLVHGLDEKTSSAWTHEESGCFWPLDLLSKEDNIIARILSLEYKADVPSFFGSSSADRILHHAQTLVEELNAEREHDGTNRRPILFICHGLGGIIVKKALIYSSMSTSSKFLHQLSVLFFFGTPHEGVKKANWSLLTRGWKGLLKDRSNFITAMEKDSETMENITEQFAPLLKQFHIHNFWETLETHRAFTRGYIVTPSSAAPAWDDTGRSGLPGTHSSMCKFRDRGEPGYKTIYGVLARFQKLAGPTISARSKQADDFLNTQRQFEANEILAFNVHQGNKPFSLTLETTANIGNKHFLVPHEISKFYIGREKLALDLRERFLAPLDKQKRYVLYGLGGSGKSQFCLKFASDNKQRFWGVFWVNASTQALAEQAFCDFARIENLEEKFETGLHWLSKQERPWLLIIDNADDTQFDYARYFPAGGQGHIILSSRNIQCQVHATIGFQEFISLEESDAITLLLRSSLLPGDKEELRNTALAIVKALGYLPLALIQAGSFIQQNLCSLDEYLDVFNSSKKIIFSNHQIQGRGSYEHNIYTTFEVSFNEIARMRTQRAMDAVEILQLISFFHNNEVPEALFRNAWGKISVHKQGIPTAVYERVARVFGDLVTISTSYWGWLTFLAEGRFPRIFSQAGKRWDKIRFRDAIALLRSYSLIFQNTTVESYSMHPMVQFWARERLRPQAQKLWGIMAARVLAESITTATKESDVIYRRHLIPHVDSCLSIDAVDSRQGIQFEGSNSGQFAKFAAIYAEGGRWVDASRIQELLLKQRRETLGEDSNEILEIMAELSESYWNSSDLQKALKIQEILLKRCEQRLGSCDPRTLQAMDTLGRTKWLCGAISEARGLGKQAYELSTKVLGADHPLTLSAMTNYGRSCAHLGDYKTAQRLLMAAWERRIKLLGGKHLDTLETMQELAMSCLSLNEVDEAANLMYFVLDNRKRLLGPEHAYTLWSMNDLSKIYCAQGYPRDAVEILIPTKEIALRTLGIAHIGTSMTFFNLAHSYILLDELGQAESILMELIQREESSIGPNHADVFSAKIELARVLRKKGALRKAKRISHQAFEGRSAVYGSESPRTIQAQILFEKISREVEMT
ncbi:hypothetical protein N7481_006337 [Penicillium waksmanii]|uniref:uncharacterized protein n=1 Tax=Penicillium waksmanii TaxID=69791 RepID=UPI002546B319|nr:uncharacterized protein N7481_006337 [Penicillium waksmanii]KAJ5984238.1 hypothetical protein N7481_006337 [Penicillium waksmanii]